MPLRVFCFFEKRIEKCLNGIIILMPAHFLDTFRLHRNTRNDSALYSFAIAGVITCNFTIEMLVITPTLAEKAASSLKEKKKREATPEH